mgnify:FL=1
MSSTLNINIKIILFIISLVLLIEIVNAQCSMSGWFGGTRWMFLWWLLATIIIILIIIVLVLFILWFIRQLEQPKLRTRGKNFRK